MTLREEFISARRVSTPLLAINTLDQAAAVSEICKLIPLFPQNSKSPVPNSTPIILWDILRGWYSLDKLGEVIAARLKVENSDLDLQNPTDCLLLAQQLPQNSILFMYNAHRFLLDVVNPEGVTF